MIYQSRILRAQLDENLRRRPTAKSASPREWGDAVVSGALVAAVIVVAVML